MRNPSLLYCAILCAIFIFINLKKIGFKNKPFILPSTIFAFTWLLATLGIFLYSNGLIEDGEYYVFAEHLETIGSYQLEVFTVIFLAFFLVHFKYRNISFAIPFDFANTDIPIVRKKAKLFLYLFFLVGIIRLAIVVSTTGFDYAAMRSYYVEGRVYFTSFDTNLIRIGSYLLVFAQFYICLLGIESASKGLKFKQLLIDFLLFSPFQMSYGGRLFVISFFMPFLFAYLLTFNSLPHESNFERVERKKIQLLILVPVIFLIFFQMLKMDATLDADTFAEFSTEIFYTSSAYRFMNEYYDNLPLYYDLGLGRNILGMGSKIHNDIIEYWVHTRNSAVVCIPSMMPQMYLDFGRVGSLFVYFILFYNLEKYAYLSLRNISLKGFLTFILLCLIAFLTSGSSVSDLFKSLIAGYIAICILCKLLNIKANNK